MFHHEFGDSLFAPDDYGDILKKMSQLYGILLLYPGSHMLYQW
jgi:hypothetical protein